MSQFKLNRRTLIRGAGSIAIALPWLEAMTQSRTASAQTATVPLKRFVTLFQPGGTVRQGTLGDRYTPTGTETAFTLSPILAPLEPMKSRLLIIDGLTMKCADQSVYAVEQHQGGSVGLLTGAIQPSAGNYPKSASIDQLLAAKLSTGKSYGSLQLGVRWATGKSHGKLSPINAVFFQAASPYSPIPPRLDPQDIFNTLFGKLPTDGGTGMTDPNNVATLRRKSILDFVDKKYVGLSAKLGARDRAKLDEHLTQIRELEKRLTVQPPTGTTACKAPTKVSTTGYNPTSGLNSADNGSLVDSQTDAKIPDVGKFMMDMLVTALACDMTGVASLQWSDTEAKHTFPWLNLPDHHHFYQHDGGFKAAECEKICTWYSQMHLYMLQKMQAVDMGGHTLLDESLVFVGSEISHPPTHSKTNMPFFLAGGTAATLKTGRWIKQNGAAHNRLLTSIFNLFGDTRTSFGDSKVESNALTGLV
jgi:hypothetical protein